MNRTSAVKVFLAWALVLWATVILAGVSVALLAS